MLRIIWNHSRVAHERLADVNDVLEEGSDCVAVRVLQLVPCVIAG